MSKKSMATVKQGEAMQDSTMKQIRIEPIKRLWFRITIKQRGTSVYVSHAWSEKARKMLRLTAAERKKLVKEKRDPDREAEFSKYFTKDGEVGIPAMAFKKSLITAAHKDIGFEKTTLRKAIFIICPDANGVLPMKYDEAVIREDMVRVGQNQTDLRYRPEFRNWRISIPIEIDNLLLTVQDVINLTNRAGFGVGIGEWRPEKDGEWGRFEVDTSVPIETLPLDGDA